jgi:hypothetical protein
MIDAGRNERTSSAIGADARYSVSTMLMVKFSSSAMFDECNDERRNSVAQSREGGQTKLRTG